MDAAGAFVRVFERFIQALVRFFGHLFRRPSGSWDHEGLLPPPFEPEPPQDWLERVRRGAPGLLEPSVREQARRQAQRRHPPAAPAARAPAPQLTPIDAQKPAALAEIDETPTAPSRVYRFRRLVLGETRRTPASARPPAAHVVAVEAQRDLAEPPRVDAAGEPPEFEVADAPIARERLAWAEHQPAEPMEPLPREWSVQAPDPASYVELTSRLPVELRPVETIVRPRPIHATRSVAVPPRPVADLPTGDADHAWPELPAQAPLPTTEVESALRAWAREQRIEEEQMHL